MQHFHQNGNCFSKPRPLAWAKVVRPSGLVFTTLLLIILKPVENECSRLYLTRRQAW